MLTDQSLDVCCHVADVSDATSMHDLASWCQSEHGPVHLLFNNAGVASAELLPIWRLNPMIGNGLMGLMSWSFAWDPSICSWNVSPWGGF